MKKTKAQNLLEFAFISPLLIILLFGIIEYSLFMRNVNVVQNLATEAAVIASREFVFDTMTSGSSTSPDFNIAASQAAKLIELKASSFGLSSLDLVYNDSASFGAKPYAIYEFNSTLTTTVDSATLPLIKLNFDYRNPNTGLELQLIYQYKTLLLGAELPLPGGGSLVLIPRNIPISSSKVIQYVQY